MSARASNNALVSARVRARMVERVRAQGVRDPRALAALESVPRHLFVDAALASRAYEDVALPIGHGQTISRPYIVARSLELALQGIADPARARVLEIGTGCGYAAAVLAQVFGTVVSIERLRPLHELARTNLRALRLPNLRLVLGDGRAGIAVAGPFDAVIAAAAGEQIPSAWIEQLSPGGRIVAPVGAAAQRLTVVAKTAQGQVNRQTMEAVRFVPLKAGVS
jgi:protein-L-isoaspartate(D-aspartate) O-methyltransferase